MYTWEISQRDETMEAGRKEAKSKSVGCTLRSVTRPTWIILSVEKRRYFLTIFLVWMLPSAMTSRTI